jgi:hypothetical protein
MGSGRALLRAFGLRSPQESKGPTGSLRQITSWLTGIGDTSIDTLRHSGPCDHRSQRGRTLRPRHVGCAPRSRTASSTGRRVGGVSRLLPSAADALDSFVVAIIDLEKVLASVRRTRWLIALLLLLFGQVEVVRASAVPACPRFHDAVPESSSSVASLASAEVAKQVMAHDEAVSADHAHHPATNTPSAYPMSGCGGTALPVMTASAELPPAAAPSFPLVDAGPPLLSNHAFFRPPQLS